MPGFTYLLNLIPSQKSIHELDLDVLLHNENYQIKTIEKDENSILIFSHYNSYPMKKIEYEYITIYIEGKIYNKTEQELINAFSCLNSLVQKQSSRLNPHISKLVKEFDGEYLIFVKDLVNNNILVFNNYLGRLPLYLYQDKNYFIITREIVFIYKNCDISIDKIALSQFLLLGYPLSESTLYKGVKRIKPASLICIENNKINYKNIDHNYDEVQFTSSVDMELIKDLVSILSDSCQTRSNKQGNVLLLSGGCDSRAILCVLLKLSIPFKAFTYLDFENISLNDMQIAKLLHRSFNFNWTSLLLENTKQSDCNFLFDIKAGLNHLGMSFMIQFFNKILMNTNQNITLLTGDGGDKILRDITPHKNITALDSLINYLLYNNTVFPLEIVSDLTNIDKTDIYDILYSLMQSYPEKKISSKYVHFLINERAFKWLFEGEDRNRFFFWSTTPFYSLPLFKYSMSINPKIKSNFQLYKKLIRDLNPTADKIAYTNWKANISVKYPNVLRQLIINSKKAFEKSVGNILKKGNNIFLYPSSSESLLNDYGLKNEIGNYLNIGALKKLYKLTKAQSDTIFTLITTISKTTQRK